jgi:hyaluronoglucosaminidase
LIPELGIIEGFYGKPWSWDARAYVTGFLASHGYRFYLYAPKGDAFLRRRWQEPYPADTINELRAFAHHCAALNVRFGVGLSPYEIYRNFDDAARTALADKLETLDHIGISDLAILFDDMRGDMDGLARQQAEIVHWIRERSQADRIIMCPTYYSNDPVLDRIFGARPHDYLEVLGRELHPDVQVFWTGEEICSRALSVGDLQRTGDLLQRKPFVWDNYPVNDTARMSRYLHLRGFTGRPASIAPHVSAHGVNPALQPTLSLIPALTLADSYRRGDNYAYGASTDVASQLVLGDVLAALVRDDMLWFTDVGRDRLDEERIASLRERYAKFDQEGAKEIVAWLDGAYQITDAIIRSQ